MRKSKFRLAVYAGLFCLTFLLIALFVSNTCTQICVEEGDFLNTSRKRSNSDTPNKSKYCKARFEGLTSFQSAKKMIPYLRKYKNKCFNATYDEAELFGERQKLVYYSTEEESNGSGFRIAFTGDIMWTGKVDSSLVSKRLKKYLSKFEFVIGNLETPIDTLRRVKSFFPDYVKYNGDKNLIDEFYHDKLNKNLFSILTLANNHALDMGYDGLVRTINLLENRGIDYVGISGGTVKRHSYSILEKNGMKVGICAATWGTNRTPKQNPSSIKINTIKGIASYNSPIMDITDIANDLSELERKGVDLKIVLLHWGYEYEWFPDSLIQKLAIEIVLSGADIIIGHHPHIVQPIEMILLNGYEAEGMTSNTSICKALTDSTMIPRKALICYSLGNFLTRMYTNDCRKGVIAPVYVYKNETLSRGDWKMELPVWVYNSVPPLPGKRHKIDLLQ